MKTSPISRLVRLLAASFALCASAHAGVVLSGGGLTLVEEGGSIAPGNLATGTASAFAKDVLLPPNPSHTIAHLTDQTFGNSNSWIGNSDETYAGVVLGTTPVNVWSIAFGRDNTGSVTDRTLGLYKLQYTANPNPSALTAVWTDIGTLDYQSAGGPNFAFPSKRHRYLFNPVAATGIRLIMPTPGTCIDELEVYPVIVVANSADSGAGSLRQAFATAAAAPGANTITFAQSLSGQTITFLSDIVINDTAAVTVDGSILPGGITLSGNNAKRLFTIPATRSLTLTGLNLSGGNGDGQAFSGYGGAIQSAGTLTVTQCTLSGNSATIAGGAIDNYLGTATLTQCTFSGNSSEAGGAISNVGTLTVTHCTISGNSATGASGEGGGIWRGPGGGTMTITNCIVAGNTAGTAATANISGAITQTGVNITTGDPLLATLGNYGGPTRTRPPLLTSPAIDAAAVLSPAFTTDQRGRAIAGLPDIGAVELGSRVTTGADELDPVSSSGAGISLREAVRDTAEGGVIGFAPALSGGTCTLIPGRGEVVLGKGVTIDASSLPAGITIDGGTGTNRIFSVRAEGSSPSVTLRKLTLTGGNGAGAFNPGQGGAIQNLGGMLTLTQCILSGNSATFGGAINSDQGSAQLTLTQCTLSGNSAGTTGGAIYFAQSLTVTQCTLSGNSASVGGAIGSSSNAGDTATLTQCTLSGNSAVNTGGAIHNAIGATLTLTNSIVAGNTGTNGPDISNGGSINATGRNVIGALANSGLSAGAAVINAAALLAPLGNYGGPTQTMQLLPGSPARNSATVLSPAITSDQRGFPIVGMPDIGAYETQIGAIANQTTNEETATGAIPFTVGTVGALSATSGNTTLVPNANITLGGSSANRTAAIAPAPADQNGSAVITITEATNGESQAFTLTVTPVNDAPSFTKGADQTVAQNSGLRTVTGWATAPVYGPPDESTQSTLAFIVTNNNNALFSAQPAVGTSGTLTFTPALNASGIATVTARIQDNGGTANGGVDTSTPQTFTIAVLPQVSTAADTGPGSLRQALASAAVIPGPNTITFAPGLSGQTITFASEIVISDTAAVTIDASSLPQGVTLSGNNVARHFTVDATSSLTLTGVTLTGGNGTGAAFSGAGGAILSFGNVTLTRCALNNNSSANTGGAISSTSFGGATVLTLTNCTFTANSSATGGAIYNGAGSTATIWHCTISGNTATQSGGIRADGTVNFHSSIISGNTGGGTPNLGGNFWSGINSIVNVDPLLGPLADNGGPTKTMALLPGSPALDLNNQPLPGVGTDQRGLPRSREGNGTGPAFPDAGAVEMQTPPSAGAEQIRVTILADENDPTGTLGAGISLREAVRHTPPGGIIGFDATLSGQSIVLTSGAEIVLGKSVTIDASSLPAGITINGGAGTNRIFFVGQNQVVSLLGMSLTGGGGTGTAYTAAGGAVAVNLGASATLTRCTLTGNSTSGIGGAIYLTTSATVTLNHCTLSGNSSSSGGGAIHNNNGSVVLNHSTISGNTAGGNGGGYSGSTPLVLTNSIVAGNFATGGLDVAEPLSEKGLPVPQGGPSGAPSDIYKTPASAVTTNGVNFIGTLANSGLTAGPTILTGDPLLAPLGNYGGPTRTMALKPGSLARNAAAVLSPAITADQRGFPIVGTPDIGAYEAGTFNSFATWAWETAGGGLNFTLDNEKDGAINGLEYATRRNPNVSDVPLSPTLAPDGLGGNTFQFRYQKDARDLRYIVQRSPDLALPSSGWVEIYRYDSRTGQITELLPATGDENATTQLITITDPALGTQFFWRLLIEQVP